MYRTLTFTLSVQWSTFLVAHWIFSITYWKISLKMPVMLANKPPQYQNTKVVSIIYKLMIGLSLLVPFISQILLYLILEYPKFAKNSAINPKLLLVGFMQLLYATSLTTLYFLADGLIRIYRCLDDKSLFY